MEKISFTPKARLIKILGEQLIKDASVGIIELIKNSYDADATKVEIIMHSLNTQNAKIIIKDNGVGMSLDTFITKWMNPATGHKELQKERNERTILGRLPLGEKGVGRFAAQQIGNYLSLISKTASSNQELNVIIDWKKFDDKEKDLSDIEVEYEMKNPTTFNSDQTGTYLEISNIKSIITENDIKKISNSLRRMKSPFKGDNNFDIKLDFINCKDDLSHYSNLEATDLLDKAPFSFCAIIDDNGILDFEYKFNYPGIKQDKIIDRADIANETKEKINKDLKIGSFFINIYAFLKQTKDYKNINYSDKDLNEWCGVSVYRDGIRILPYGEKGNDWLKLDNRRIQSPGTKFSNDQVIGMIEINQSSNICLKDKTNREGLIEDKYYEKFQSLILGTITIFEAILLGDRKKVNPPKDKTNKQLVQEKVDSVKSDLALISKEIEDRPSTLFSNARPLLNKVEGTVLEIKQDFSNTIDELEKEKQILFNLAGTGLAAERFTHEFARLVSGALSSLDRLKKRINIEDPKTKKEIDSLSGALEALRNDIRLLGPMFYIKKVAKEKELDIYEIIKNTISLQEPFIEKAGIKLKIEGTTFKTTMREGSCMQIFNNLIDNSIFWCSKKSEVDNKQIKIIIDKLNHTVYLTDSGPGIALRYRDKIFDPFFSMKGEDGRGLGLYIVKEILDEKNFGIFLIDEEAYNGLLSGASFKIVFNNRMEN
jgi:signal transduction histidine kinase